MLNVETKPGSLNLVARCVALDMNATMKFLFALFNLASSLTGRISKVQVEQIQWCLVSRVPLLTLFEDFETKLEGARWLKLYSLILKYVLSCPFRKLQLSFLCMNHK